MQLATRTLAMLFAVVPLSLVGCGDEEPEVVVGSRELITVTTDVQFVESVRISMPFKARVFNGPPRQVMLRGEDNLVGLIEVVETEVSHYEIRASYALAFEQHDDIEIELPYIDMVEIRVDGTVEFEDQPSEVWFESD